MTTPGPQHPANPVPPDMVEPGRAEREYGHSSEDRNTRKRESDWPGFEGGAQREATPGAPGEVSHRES